MTTALLSPHLIQIYFNDDFLYLCSAQERGIKLLQSIRSRPEGSDSEDEDERPSAGIAQLSLDSLTPVEVTGAQVFLDEQGSVHWPVLFLYPEHQQSDFISAFCENNR